MSQPDHDDNLNEWRQMRQRLREGRARSALPPEEHRLIERVIANDVSVRRWLGMRDAVTVPGGASVSRVDHVERCLHRAHCRYMTAVQELATVRPGVDIYRGQ